ncbi:Metal-dependent hydrolase [Vibrio chagasii]|uniref:endonuclease/exonuclease/phosphatase family protein n=1 Tax=Vibrio chagasii TaxID=170679 RepID=UPI001EFED5FC|nr:endonuclease/exonuclease/phosphatase family protein [Vibrio chagasii]MDE9381721.1 endonuclease/exonuclease/phosphatase family protein [Vibrio alginolyticus]MCG9561163.1 endonuclease/exonuclease/phosphatase family protein [Vibrio chagasii]MCG9606118.1 endonuclease/exonuclease/phosphatase family protein [Vibrio chagasii]CAH6823123.1 Metal-dependent hydrolase [Vibrio chagasii]CAH6840102.1 Metal-dependent hydrolase [Vibrio chagasii]
MKRLQKWLMLGCLIGNQAIAEPLTISSWNIEWLSTNEAVNKFSNKRDQADFDKLGNYFQSLNADVVAFQEVDDVNAIQRVAGDQYQILMSDRALPKNSNRQFKEVNQYTGFAVRKGVTLTDYADFPLETTPNSKLRFASYIVIKTETKPIHMLSVHLKAGCSGAYKSNRDCSRLKEQAQQLNKWIKQRERNNEDYAILGDFNHNLAYSRDWMWKELTQYTDAQLATRKTRADCKVRSNRNSHRTHQFRSVIDHVVVSESLNADPAKQQVFETQDVLDYKLSDHCPVSTTIKQ